MISRPWLHRWWPEIALGCFVAVCLASMLFVPGWEAVPFHFVYVSVTIVYGIRLWPRTGVLVAAGAITVLLGCATFAAVTAARESFAELLEVPMMSLMFLATFWHVRSRQRAARSVAELAAARAELIERERALFTNASHELLTPLTIALGHLEEIDRGTAPVAPQVREAHGVVVDELRRMEALVTDLLAIGRLEASSLELQEVELRPMLTQIAHRWSRAAPRAWSIDVAVRGKGCVDRVALGHALDGILSNAVKYTADGDAIRFRAARRHQDLVITVEDGGSGIPDDDLDRVFERFYRAPGRTRRRRGSGLGLAIAQQVVHGHGGSIRATRGTHGRGTRIIALLPVMMPTPAPAPPAKLRPELAVEASGG